MNPLRDLLLFGLRPRHVVNKAPHAGAEFAVAVSIQGLRQRNPIVHVTPCLAKPLPHRIYEVAPFDELSGDLLEVFAQHRQPSLPADVAQVGLDCADLAATA